MSGAYAPLYALVRQIPSGKVATYGQLAGLVGLTARQVGYAMAATPLGEGIPWHRVINSQGRLSLRADGSPSHRQYVRLTEEGVGLANPGGRIDLETFQWRPDWSSHNSDLETPPDLPGLG